MACIAGTVQNPKLWYTKDGLPVLGRRPDGRALCPRLSPYTSVSLAHRRPGRKLASCDGCPCYRGIDAFGVLQEGYGVQRGEDGVMREYVVSFTEAEYEKWLELDFDWPAFVAWKDAGALASSSIARLPRDGLVLDEGLMGAAQTYDRERQRRYRAEHPGDRRKRDRKAYMREYMRRRRLAHNDSAQGRSPATSV